MARHIWWANRVGLLRAEPAQLDLIHQSLRNHHSYDPAFGAQIMRLTKHTQYRQDGDPHFLTWKCRLCNQLRSGKMASCADCHKHWSQCYDREFDPQRHHGRNPQSDAPDTPRKRSGSRKEKKTKKEKKDKQDRKSDSPVHPFSLRMQLHKCQPLHGTQQRKSQLKQRRPITGSW